MFERKPSSDVPQDQGEWIQAEVFFREGQKLDERFPQLRASGEVRFQGGWLHFRPIQEPPTKVVTLPAEVVKRVEWTIHG
ncbi:hypothetical protein GXW83_19530 [Streptacidiphilus sp. PB12-B1b]|uniref:hypothetical protein n=1 Tax=Streptacidiphilus sp. PB12-B1b TaxID=2705012 RepID=UPI0015FA2AE2|nr:hypothetical protein [Streptacidiphilus sp. PB12-B1b]QMU77557.1 hypothetical protein GXW83_19530 [Streptacidiphilus sp. PB12-B1b]